MRNHTLPEANKPGTPAQVLRSFTMNTTPVPPPLPEPCRHRWAWTVTAILSAVLDAALNYAANHFLP